MKKTILLFVFIAFAATSHAAEDLTKYVNPMVGTAGHGHTFPGACVPFGMVQLSPDTRLSGWDGCSAYHFSDTLIYGFSHTHLSGTGCSDYGDILFMPTLRGPTKTADNRASAFDHLVEMSEPGYYGIKLKSFDIMAELTATKRCGMHKYSYPNNLGRNYVFLDLKHRDKVVLSELNVIDKNTISGVRISKAWADEQKVYFYAKFDKPIKEHIVYVYGKPSGSRAHSAGEELKAFFAFDSCGEVTMKIGISAVGIDNARKNLEAEIKGWDFDEVRAQAKKEWNDYLSKIEVKGDPERMKTFYSALYHTAISPNLYSDVDGSYLGRDLKPHKAEGYDYYTVFSLWDTYRAFHPLMTLIDQKRTTDYIKTFLDQFKYGGKLPVWELSSNETDCMIGYHSVPVIVDAFLKGITGFDKDKALEAMLASANDDNYRGIGDYKLEGYVKAEKEGEAVSKTLEYAFDDWCIAQYAQKIGNQKIYKEFIKRAQSYKHLFDPTTGFMRARKNGGWVEPFDPYEVNNYYTEANSWQYSFYVPQDLESLIAYHGGREAFSAKLDSLFSVSSKTTGRDQSDISGLIGQYAHGNEPSHHIAYLYDYAGQPWKTQEMVVKIADGLYSSKEDGLCGNEDCGQMSAWYILSALGFYSVCPGEDYYVIGTPLFEKVILNLENGKKFKIGARNISRENKYIQSIKLNGKPYSKMYIRHSDIMAGGDILFEMGPSPNMSFGTAPEDAPPSAIKDLLITPQPFYTKAPEAFRDSFELEIKSLENSATVYALLSDKSPGGMTKYSAGEKLNINQSCMLNSFSLSEGKSASRTISGSFHKIKNNYRVIYTSEFSKQYSCGGADALIDEIRGESHWRKGNWQGYTGRDFEAIVDLNELKNVKKVSVGFLQDVMAWIVMPIKIEFYASTDNVTYTKLDEIPNDVSDENKDVIIKNYSTHDGINTQARYIKVIGWSYGTLPSWHPGYGGQSLIFVDEITVE